MRRASFARSSKRGNSRLERGRLRHLPEPGTQDQRVVIARKVLQHQPHWCPIVITALRSADVVCAGIGYLVGQGLHDSRLSKTGHYNTKLSLSRMEIEAEAMGLDLQLETFADPGRPQEAVATFRWA